MGNFARAVQRRGVDKVDNESSVPELRTKATSGVKVPTARAHRLWRAARLASGPVWRPGDLSAFAAGWRRQPGHLKKEI